MTSKPSSEENEGPLDREQQEDVGVDTKGEEGHGERDT